MAADLGSWGLGVPLEPGFWFIRKIYPVRALSILLRWQGARRGPCSSYSNHSVSTLLLLCDPNTIVDAAEKLTPVTRTYVKGTQTLFLDRGNLESGGWSPRPCGAFVAFCDLGGRPALPLSKPRFPHPYHGVMITQPTVTVLHRVWPRPGDTRQEVATRKDFGSLL